jgi:hypothetical protein
MRTTSYIAVAGLLVMACGGRGAGEIFDNSGPMGGAGSDGQAGGPSKEWNGELAPATQIATGEASLLGVTRDGWAVFREQDMLMAAAVEADEAVKAVSVRPGNVLIRGNVVFNWADVDWERGVGDLSVWSAEGGTHEVGETPYVEGLVAASESGTSIVYTANTTDTTTDLMITANDFAAPIVLIPAMGLGTEETCGANIGFVGERLFVGWCAEGSRAATIERFELVDGEWQTQTIATDALPAWSSDAKGERVFYQSSDYAAYVAEGDEATTIDASVSTGQITPDGTAVLYTVGDQLRRSGFPDVNPVPIVTTGYKQPVGFSPGFDLALYSTTVTYEEGTRRDLRLVNTDGLNTDPVELVDQPVAALGRSTMTRDGEYVFYLTDMSMTGATLHVVAKDGNEVLALPGVVEVVAAHDSTLVFTDNSSDPSVYPVVADLKVLNLANETEPRLVEEKIIDGKNFYLDADGTLVTYTRSGVDRDAEASDSKGLFMRQVK